VSAAAALDELRAGDEPRYGGKSAALGELLAGGIPVPPGFAISTDAFHAFLAGASLVEPIAERLGALDPDDVDAVRAAAAWIAEAIGAAPVPEALAAEIGERYAALGDGDPPVAVRSSACGEDSAEATFAGQQETYLWVRGADDVTAAVRDCWASLYSPPAITYRAKLGDAGTVPAMGVAVQAMVDAAVAGVMFTCNPVTGDPSVVAIDASWGLGLGVVGGEVTPDQYFVNKVSRALVRSAINRKEIEYRPAAGGSGAVSTPVDDERAEAPCLGEDDLRALLDVSRSVQAHFGGGHQDIEWALDGDGALFVLQARPVTATAKADGPKNVDALSLVMSTFGVRPGDAS
jgi:pyruvate,water dikinase